ISAVHAKLQYYSPLLRLDSSTVGMAYMNLTHQTWRQCGIYRSAAWKAQIIANDSDVPKSAYFPYDNHPKYELCLLAMRRELTPWGIYLRHFTIARLSAQRAIRDKEGVKTTVTISGLGVPTWAGDYRVGGSQGAVDHDASARPSDN